MLTAKQEQFCQNIAQGMTQADAYRFAYDSANMLDKTIIEEASRMMSDCNISTRVQELRNQIAKEKIMSAQDRLIWLSELIQSETETTGDKLRASDQMNKMQGEYVTKIEGDIKVKRLEDVL